MKGEVSPLSWHHH